MAEKMPRRLVLLSSAAIGVVYVAGYVGTRTADAQLASGNDTVAVAAAQTTLAANTTQQAVAPQTAPRVALGKVQAAGATSTTTTAATTAAAAPATTTSAQLPATATAVPATATAVPPTATAKPSTVYVAPRATATPAPAKSTTQNASQYKDGSYTAWGSSRRGDVQVDVTITSGNIAKVTITDSTTQYPVAWISRLPGQVVAAQSANIPLISGATYSSMAFRSAVATALNQAQNG